MKAKNQLALGGDNAERGFKIASGNMYFIVSGKNGVWLVLEEGNNIQILKKWLGLGHYRDRKTW